MSQDSQAGRRRALVTNDDGISADGLRWLALAALDAGVDVVVAAPEHEASGSSAALAATYSDERLAITRTELPDVEVTAFSVRASPGYIVVLAALGAFGWRPDVVLSGVNRGANTGRAIVHSGTVGAVLTALNHDIPAMAVSLDAPHVAVTHPPKASRSAQSPPAVEHRPVHWPTARQVAASLVPELAGLPRGTALNVNVPNLPIGELRGTRQATLADFGHVQVAIAASGEGFVRTAMEPTGQRLVPGSDLALLADGFASVTVIASVREVDGPLEL